VGTQSSLSGDKEERFRALKGVESCERPVRERSGESKKEEVGEALRRGRLPGEKKKKKKGKKGKSSQQRRAGKKGGEIGIVERKKRYTKTTKRILPIFQDESKKIFWKKSD